MVDKKDTHEATSTLNKTKDEFNKYKIDNRKNSPTKCDEKSNRKKVGVV